MFGFCVGALDNNFRHWFIMIHFLLRTLNPRQRAAPLRLRLPGTRVRFHHCLTNRDSCDSCNGSCSEGWFENMIFQDMYQEGFAFNIMKSSFVRTFKVKTRASVFSGWVFGSMRADLDAKWTYKSVHLRCGRLLHSTIGWNKTVRSSETSNLNASLFFATAPLMLLENYLGLLASGRTWSSSIPESSRKDHPCQVQKLRRLVRCFNASVTYIMYSKLKAVERFETPKCANCWGSWLHCWPRAQQRTAVLNVTRSGLRQALVVVVVVVVVVEVNILVLFIM